VLSPDIQHTQQLAKNVEDASNASTAPPPAGPHAKLLSIVQGIAVGLGSFGKAMATHGKEGGVEDVLAYNKQQQEMQIQAQRARDEAKNQKVSQAVTAFQTNVAMGNAAHLAATWPKEAEQRDLQIAGEKQAQSIQSADFQMQFGMKPEDFNKSMDSKEPANGSAANQIFVTKADQTLKAAQNFLPETDPYVQKLQATLADKNSTPRDLAMATNAVQTQQDKQSKSNDEKLKQEQANAANRPKDLNDAVGRMTQAQQAYKANPNVTTKAALDAAVSARTNFLDAAASEARIKQAAQDGNPEDLASGLVNGDIAWSQVVSTRKSEFATAAFKAADKLSMEQTGQHFSAVVNQANYQQATNPQVQQKLKMIEGMTEKGGSIDIAKQQLKALPQMDSKIANQVFNATATQFGSPELTNFHTAMLGLADEYSQVMGAGGGSDTSRQQALDLLNAAWAKGQLSGAVDIMQKDIAARQRGLVNGNPALMRLFPAVAQSSGQQVSLKSAMALPINKGKTEAQVRADIESHGHQVSE
jgi:hypothetical protein